MFTIFNPTPPRSSCYVYVKLSTNIYTSSWDVAYNALCDPKTASKSVPLRNFLSAEENLNILSRPWRPFAEPSTEAKNRFETRTAPVNVTPSNNGGYNLDEIKEDTLWLSKQANISEDSRTDL